MAIWAKAAEVGESEPIDVFLPWPFQVLPVRESEVA